MSDNTRKSNFSPYRVVPKLCIGFLLLIAQTAAASGEGWYAGAGAGVSWLEPETDGTGFSLESDNAVSSSVYLGWDLNDWLSVETAYTDLGKAKLSGNESIGYSALSLGVVGFVLGNSDASGNDDRWRGYLRLGLNRIKYASGMSLKEENDTAFWLGAGIQWPLGDSFGLRGELTSFDGDAQAVLTSLYWRPFSRSSAVPDTTASDLSTPVSALVPDQEPVVEPEAVICLAPEDGEPVGEQGCALFKGVVGGITFTGDTSALTFEGRRNLQRLISSLEEYPQVVVELLMHTKAYPDAGRADALSRKRVLTVARYLVERGVRKSQLRARAFGSRVPRSFENTPLGRELNNRLELRVL